MRNILLRWLEPKSGWPSVTSTARDHSDLSLQRSLNQPIAFTDHACQVAESIRNAGRDNDEVYPPAIFLHGVMPRCGSVYAGNLIKLHPDLHAYPNEIWEWPFLSSTKHLMSFQDEMFSTYSQLEGRLGPNDMLRIFSAASLNYLLAGVPEGKRLFMKEPRTEFLSWFFELFPNEKLIVLVRDGRDLVNSTIKSWPHYDFEATCQEWAKAARYVQAIQSQFQNHADFLYARFETLVERPGDFVSDLCRHCDLNESRFPRDEIENLQVQGSSEVRAGDSVGWEPMKKPKSFNPIGRWRGWSNEQKSIFKRFAGEALIESGYEENDDW